VTAAVLCAVIFLCLLVQAFFAASEMALISLDYIRIKDKAEKGDTYARIAVFFQENPRLLFGTTLLGVNAALVLNSATASFLARTLFDAWAPAVPQEVRSLATTVVLAPVILFFAEFLPMGFSRLHPAWILSRGILLFRTLHLVLYPLVMIVYAVSKAAARAAGADFRLHSSLLGREELESYITGSFTSSESHSSMYLASAIKEALRFSKTCARDIMTPLARLKALPHTAAPEDVRRHAARYGHSRIPVYHRKRSDLIGYVRAVDFIGAPGESGSITSSLRVPPIVPGHITLSRLLPLMTEQGEHMVFTADHRGRITGIVTDEDVVEEIFGYIFDEHDFAHPGAENDYMYVRPEMTAAEVNEIHGLALPGSPGRRTLGEYLVYVAGRVPKPGERIRVQGLVFTVEEVKKGKITKLSVERSGWETA